MKKILMTSLFALGFVALPAHADVADDLVWEWETLQETNPTPDPSCAQKCSATFQTAVKSCRGSDGQQTMKCVMKGLMELMQCHRACRPS